MIARKLSQDDFAEFCRIMTMFFEYAGNEIPSQNEMKGLLRKASDEKENLMFIGPLKIKNSLELFP